MLTRHAPLPFAFRPQTLRFETTLLGHIIGVKPGWIHALSLPWTPENVQRKRSIAMMR